MEIPAQDDQRRRAHEVRIDGWTVYRMPEGWRAVSLDDPALVVEHLDPVTLTRACEAIARPSRTWRTNGPGSGINT
jgi:hypothetical protein